MGIRVCSYAAIVFCIAWAVFYAFFFVGIFTGCGGVRQAVDWSQHTAFKVFFLFIDLISLSITIGLCVWASGNFIKGSKDGVVFPKSNVKLFFWLALSYFMHRLCWSNHPIYFQGEITFGYAHTIVVIPFCILFFAFMYKVAADAVEENNLTV